MFYNISIYYKIILQTMNAFKSLNNKSSANLDNNKNGNMFLKNKSHKNKSHKNEFIIDDCSFPDLKCISTSNQLNTSNSSSNSCNDSKYVEITKKGKIKDANHDGIDDD